MSSWIRDGLQNLTGYFGAEVDEDLVTAGDAVSSSDGINDRDASSNKITITSHDQGVHKNHKREAVGISSASLEAVSSDTRLIASDETYGNSYAAATKRRKTFLTSKSLPDDDNDEDYSRNAEAEILRPAFTAHLEELKQFIVDHGHMSIPWHELGRRSSLRRWVGIQRFRYRALPKGYCHYRVMTQAEIDALTGVGFAWEPCDEGSSDQSSRSTATSKSGSKGIQLDPCFQEHLDEAKAYQVQHGHMNPPSKEQGKKSKMYNWLNYQRLRRRAFPHRYHHNRRMTQEEIDALDAIGFDWQLSVEPSPEPPVRSSTTTKVPATFVDGKQKRIVSDDVRPTANAPGKINIARHSPPPSPNDKKPAVKSKAGNAKILAEKPKTGEHLHPSFQERLRELEQFIAAHGHMNPKRGEVYNWIKYQRLRRHTFLERYGKKNRPMKQSEIDALDAIGFVWEHPSCQKSAGGK